MTTDPADSGAATFFTESRDPRAEAGIGAIVRQIRNATEGMPEVSAVLLGGSLARAEASWDPTGEALRSDIEVYLVSDSSRVREQAAGLTSRLSRQTGADVSVAWLHPHRLELGKAKNLSFRPSSTIQHYDLATGHRLLSGSAPRFAVFDGSALPLAEGIRLILNRCAEGAPALADGAAESTRWVDKLLIAAGDALLLSSGTYALQYRERANRVREVQPTWSMPVGWRALVMAGYDRKLTGRGGTSDPAAAAEVAMAVLRGAVERELGMAVVEWADFPQQFARLAARRAAFLRYLLPLGPSAVYEGVLLVIRVRHAGCRLAPRAIREALAGRPLSLWIQGAAAPMLLAVVHGDQDLSAAVRSALVRAGVPAREVSRCQSESEVAALLARYWRVSS